MPKSGRQKLNVSIMDLVVLTTYLLSCFHLSYGIEGTLFYLTWFSSPPEDAKNCDIQIFISSMDEGNFTITEYFDIPYIHDARSLSNKSIGIYQESVTMSLPCKLPEINKTSNFSIAISSTVDISVQVSRGEAGSGGGYLALPLTVNSTRFHLASYASKPSSKQFGLAIIVSLFNETVVRFHRFVGTATVEFLRINLMENEVYTLGAGPGIDLTGIEVVSSLPIAVFSGHSCAAVPSTVNTQCDYMIEQIPPVSQWGNTFIMSSFYGGPYNTDFVARVIAQTPTVVTYFVQSDSSLNEVRSKTLLKGEWDQRLFSSSMPVLVVVVVNCSSDCLVMQYNPTHNRSMTETSQEWNDPFMITVPDINHYVNDAAFRVSSSDRSKYSDEDLNGLTVIVKTEDVGKLLLNNQPIAYLESKAYAVNISESLRYEIYYKIPEEGPQFISTKDPDVTFAVFVYGHGFGNTTSYGYLGGYGYIFGDNDLPLELDYGSRTDKFMKSEINADDPASAGLIAASVCTGLLACLVVCLTIYALVSAKRKRESQEDMNAAATGDEAMGERRTSNQCDGPCPTSMSNKRVTV